MDLDIFNRELNNGVSEAIKYKNNFVPRSLYKYIPLLDERYMNYTEENSKKLNSLKEKKLWISHYTSFNDPLEFRMLLVDAEKLKDTNWQTDYIEGYLNLFKNQTLVSCFSSEVDNNMPMWAHYANNHKGYCIKYSVLNPNSIFPVLYEPVRIKSSVIVTHLISEMHETYKQKLKEPTKDFYKYFTYFYLSLICKHKFWEYEKEYRLLYPSIGNNESVGKLIDLSKVGLDIDAIYIGYKCDEQYVSELIKIGNNLGCSVYKMDFDDDENFQLIKKKLN